MNSSFKIAAMGLSAIAILLLSQTISAAQCVEPSSKPETQPAVASRPSTSATASTNSSTASAPASAQATQKAQAGVASQDANVQDVRQSMRRLWLSSVEAPAGQDPAGELVQAIKQLDAMNVSRKTEPAKEPVVVVAASNPATTSAPAETVVATGELTGEVLEKLKALSPDDLEDPAAVADQLYQASQPSAAAILYELAMKKNSPTQDKAWLLLQIGNCKVKTDQAAALVAYRQVAADYGSSCWAAVATSKIRLIEWYKANNPQALLKSPSGK